MSEPVSRSSARQGRPFYGDDAPNWTFAWVLRATLCRLALAIWRVKVRGIEILPTEGGAILCANHIALMDSLLLWCVRLPKQPHFVAKSELYKVSGTKGKLLAWLIDMVGGMPVERGTADRVMITRATDLLKRGEWIAIFPEGTRLKGSDREALGQAMGGAAYLALRADVPLIPIGIAGTDKIMPPGARFPRFPRVSFVFGEPLFPDAFEGGRKERTTAMTEELMQAIKALRGEARAQ